MRTYRLAIVGHPIQGGIENATVSSQVFTHWLEAAFGEVAGVETEVVWAPSLVTCGVPAAEVYLVHDYLDKFAQYRENLPRGALVASFMEVPLPVRLPFTFLPSSSPAAVEIPLPFDCGEFSLEAGHEPRSVLLDHAWQAYVSGPSDWTHEVYRALEPLAGTRRIGQCMRYDMFNPPPFVEPVGPWPFRTYMAATAPFETFVVTHRGSYNGSIVDMAARGKRVVARRGYVHPEMVRRLGVLEVDSGEDLVRALDAPWTPAPCVRDHLTDMRVAARIMDAWFRRLLEQAVSTPAAGGTTR